jgi:hypothetical protein
VREVTEGFAKYLKSFDFVVPPALETESFFVPVVAHTGVVRVKVSAVGLVVESVEILSFVPQSVTVIVAVKCLPVTVTVVAPVVAPLVGEREVTEGLAKYLNFVDAVVPPGLVAAKFFVPVVAHTGVVIVKVSAVGLVVVSVAMVSLVPHSVTVTVALRFLPVAVTVVAPLKGPFAGVMKVIVGGRKNL